MHRAGKDILVGTARKGLWRIVGSRAFRSRFGHASVYGISSDKEQIVVQSSGGAFVRLRRDRFKEVHRKRSFPFSPARAISSGLIHRDVMFLGMFDSGLRITKDGEAQALEHSE